MCWCGYHELMTKGLIVFAEGVAKSIAIKAKENNVGIVKQIADEQDQLFALENYLRANSIVAGDEVATLKRGAFLGLVAVARYLIGNNPNLSEETLTSQCEVNAESITLLIKSFEASYMKNPEAYLGHLSRITIASKECGLS